MNAAEADPGAHGRQRPHTSRRTPRLMCRSLHRPRFQPPLSVLAVSPWQRPRWARTSRCARKGGWALVAFVGSAWIPFA